MTTVFPTMGRLAVRTSVLGMEIYGWITVAAQTHYTLFKPAEEKVLCLIANSYHGFKDMEIFFPIQFHVKIMEVTNT